MRAVLAIVVGIVVAFAAQTGADIVNNLLYPPPVADMFDLEQVARAMANRPAPALLLGALAYLIGALAGGIVGKLIWRHKAAAWTPAVVLALMALIIAFNLPMPGWAMFATLIAPLLGGLIANHLVKSAPPAPVEAGTEA
jgi:hypothetical protein